MADFFAKGKNPINGYGGKDHGIIELWKNDNIVSLDGGTIATLTTDKTFDAFLIEFVISPRYSTRNLISSCENGESAELLYMSLTSEGKILENRRNITITQSGVTITIVATDNTLRTLTAMGTAPTSTTDNNYLIPKRILGLIHND